VHKDNPHAQRAQYGEVEQDIGEIVGSRHRTIDRDHEDPLPETGDVLKDFSKVGNVH
jgi:hypothetical protein